MARNASADARRIVYHTQLAHAEKLENFALNTVTKRIFYAHGVKGERA
jgi:hypothetical protein